MRNFAAGAVLVLAAAACTGKSAAVSDSTRAAGSIEAATTPAIPAPGDTARADTARAVPRTTTSPPSPSVPQPTIGETHRAPGAMVSPVTRGEDPMPPLAGEMNRRNGSMKVLPPSRDSTRGPLMGFDSLGRPVPVKR